MSKPKDISNLDLPPEMLQPLPPLPTTLDWSTAARNLAATNPEYGGLIHFANAVDGVNTQAVNDRKKELAQVLKEGGKEPHPQIDALLQSQSKAIQAAEAAADSPPFPMPIAVRVDAFCLRLQARGRSKHTVSACRRDLLLVARTLETLRSATAATAS